MHARAFFTPAWILIIGGLAVGGVFAIRELVVGHTFATNHGLVWTLPLVTYIFLALMSTGVSIVLAYGICTRNQELLAQQRSLLILAIALLIGGFTALATELGSPLHMIWLLLSPNPSSPIWWMGTLYSIELALLVLKLLIVVRGWHGALDQPLAWATLIVALAAAMVLGSVFGTVVGRMDYRGLEASLLTLSLALASGTGVMVLVRSGAQPQPGVEAAFRAFVAVLTLLMALQWIYQLRASIAGTLGWVDPWMLAPLVVALLLGGRAPRLMAALVVAASLWIETAFVIGGQLASLGPVATWFGTVQGYLPNLSELAIFILGVSVAAALVRLGGQLLPAASPSSSTR